MGEEESSGMEEDKPKANPAKKCPKCWVVRAKAGLN
jgi:hypothetical protein